MSTRLRVTIRDLFWLTLVVAGMRGGGWRKDGLVIRPYILLFRAPLAIDNRCVPDRPDFDGRRVGNLFMAIAAGGRWPDSSQVDRFDMPGIFAGHDR